MNTPDIDFGPTDPGYGRAPVVDPAAPKAALAESLIEGQLELVTDDPRLPAWAGVTTVMGSTIHPGDKTLKWAWTQGHRGVMLSDRRANEDRTAGLLVHKTLEELVAGRRPHVQDLPVESRTRVEHLLAWWDETRPRVLASEASLHGEEHRVRGRLDYVRECADSACRCVGRWLPDGGLGYRGVVIGDLSTGADPTSPKISPNKRIQVGGGYRVLWPGRINDDLPDGLRDRPLCACEVVHLPNDRPYDDGRLYRVVKVGDEREAFLAALTLYRNMLQAGDLPERTL